jgi:transposase
LPVDSVLLYEDEKGPVAAKTYGGSSWSSIQSKVSKAQKIKGILNVFGVYDHTNNKMWTHSYRKKTGKQFLDFIKRVDQKYDDSIKQIFLVLDNVSIHKSNKVKQTIARYHPRIHLVFLPTRSPELNLIEVRWLWMHRQAINNSAFLNEYDIGKAVSDWTHDYNQKHTAKTSIISLHGESIYEFT